jgi:hypothetical protein
VNGDVLLAWLANGVLTPEPALPCTESVWMPVCAFPLDARDAADGSVIVTVVPVALTTVAATPSSRTVSPVVESVPLDRTTLNAMLAPATPIAFGTTLDIPNVEPLDVVEKL